MIRRPPRSTLFPYTTALPICLPFVGGRGVVPRHAPVAPVQSASARRPHDDGALARTAVPFPGLALGGVRRPDRKSTRLNSSHANISYAVFCLKKKKTAIDLSS